MGPTGILVPCWTMGRLVAGGSILTGSGAMEPVAPAPAAVPVLMGISPLMLSWRLQQLH